jgi:disulfide bond formation protein DsbB
MNTELYSTFLASLVVLAQIWFVLVLVSLVVQKITKKKDSLVGFVADNYLWVTLAFSVAGLIGSLGYSEVFGYVPCKLCWWQRISLYPVVLLSAIGLYKKDQKFLPDYIIALMVIGSLIGVFHLYLQFTPNSLDCATTGQGVSCSKNWVRIWGYITIPMMCLTAHLNTLLAAVCKKMNK